MTKTPQDKKPFGDPDRTLQVIGAVVALYIQVFIADDDATIPRRLERLFQDILPLNPVRQLAGQVLQLFANTPDDVFERAVTNFLAMSAVESEALLNGDQPGYHVIAELGIEEQALSALTALGFSENLADFGRRYRQIIETKLLKPLAAGETIDLGWITGVLSSNPTQSRGQILELLHAHSGEELVNMATSTARQLSDDLRSSGEMRAACEIMLDRAGLTNDQAALDQAFEDIGQHVRNIWGPKEGIGPWLFLPLQARLGDDTKKGWAEEQNIMLIAVYQELFRRIEQSPVAVIEAYMAGHLGGQLLNAAKKDFLDELDKQTAAMRRPKDPNEQPLRLHKVLDAEAPAADDLDLGTSVDSGGSPTTAEDPKGSPLERIILRETVEEYLADLTPREKAVFLLYYREDKLLREIGKLLGISEARASVLKKQAKEKVERKRAEDVAKALPKPPAI